MPGDYLALRLQTNRIIGSLGTHDNGSRFPGKSNPSQTCPFFFFNLDCSGECWGGRHNKKQNCQRQVQRQLIDTRLSKLLFKAIVNVLVSRPGREIAPNTGANVTNFFTLATKSWKLVAKLATRMFHHNLTKRYSELKRFAKINPSQTSLLSLFPKRNRCISIDN